MNLNDKINILWADDEIDLLKPHIMFLEQKGYKIKTANNGLSAHELVTQESFDLVFLDPPFNQNLIPITLELLSQKNYLHNESQIYIESEYEITPTLLENHLEYDCRIRKQKKSGNVHYCLISLEVI